jgi:hypothetical protein
VVTMRRHSWQQKKSLHTCLAESKEESIFAISIVPGSVPVGNVQLEVDAVLHLRPVRLPLHPVREPWSDPGAVPQKLAILGSVL